MAPGLGAQQRPPDPPPPPQPTGLSIGEDGGSVRLGALLQVWGYGRIVEDDTETTFRIRRAELKAHGDLVPGWISFGLMIDPAKVLEFQEVSVPVEGQDPDPTTPGEVEVQQPVGNVAMLQDVFITMRCSCVDISVGQFKNPVSLEGSGSSSKLILPERAAVSRRFGDRRDIGVKAEKKLGDHFYYQVGVYNGEGQNRRDSDNDKDVALRLEVYPVAGLTLAGVGYTTVGTRDGATRDRWEVDARYDASQVLAQAEYIHGWDAGAGGGPKVESHGAYLALGYTFLDRIQPVVRAGFVDRDMTVDGEAAFYYEGGVNYLVRGPKVRLGLAGAVADEESGPSQTEVFLAAQLSF